MAGTTATPVRGLGRDLTEPGASDQEQDPEREDREQSASPTLKNALGHERPADVRQRRADQLHDLNLVPPRVRREPDDVGDGQRRGDGEQRRRSRDRRRGRRGSTASEPGQQRAVVAHVRDAWRARRDAAASASTASPVSRDSGFSRTSSDAGNGLPPSWSAVRAEVGKVLPETRPRHPPSTRTAGRPPARSAST